MSGSRRLVAFALLTLGLSGCGARAHAVARASSADAKEIFWTEELVDPARDTVLSVSPRAVATDPVWGAFVGRAMDAALVHARARGGSASTLETLLRAEDVVLAVRDRDGRDVVAVVSGVPTTLSPSSLTDEDGRVLFVAVAPTGPVPTYASPSPEHLTRVYELPGGTWVFALGGGVERAERTFSRARSLRYAPPLHRMLEVRFAGALLDALRARAGHELRPIAAPLQSARLVAFGADRGEARVALTLAYRDDVAASRAEGVAARASELLSDRGIWPVRPEVHRDGATVTVAIAIGGKEADFDRERVREKPGHLE